jgi:PiT family inorganic phosphate transporter
VALFIVIASRRNPVHADNVNETHEVAIRSEASSDVRTAA